MSERHENPSVLPPDLLLQAYSQGMFPMAMESGELGWFSPDPRGIIPIRDFHVPRSMRKFLREAPFQIRINTAFTTVMRGCAKRDTTWISDTIMRSYVRLHELGFAHSVEAWQDRKLVGGLYGVAIGGAFFGESMFSAGPGASKFALNAIVQRLQERGFVLHDTQWVTSHLRMFGAHEISRTDYMARLRQALKLDCRFAD